MQTELMNQQSYTLGKKKSRNCEVVAEDWKARPLQKIRKALLKALEDRLPERV